jgi:hypothetical protein
MPLRQEYYYEEEASIVTQSTKKDTNDSIVLKKKIKAQRRKRAVLGVMLFGIAFAIVYRYTMINNVNMEIIRLKEDLEEVNTVNAQLKLAAERSVDLREIERYSREQLGLQKPQSYQIEYINLNKQDFINNQPTSENKNWIQTVIFNIIEFFN